MILSKVKCVCQNSTSINYDERITAIEQLRNQCSALRLLLIPDSIWEDYKVAELAPRDKALHIFITSQSILQGDLSKLTAPLHRYLMNHDQLKNEVIKQYREDLQEKWMFQIDEITRHQKARMFEGKIVELQIAKWLEQNGWQIYNLAALGGQYDIQSKNPPNIVMSNIEVKFIGQRDEEFQQVVNSLQGLPAGGRGPMHLILNYTMFRTYEAAQQLKNSIENRIAIIVIDRSMWVYSSIAFKNGFIDWNNPVFFDLGQEWQNLINKNRKKYPTIDLDLCEAIKTLNEVWIVVKDRHSYSLKIRHQWKNTCV